MAVTNARVLAVGGIVAGLVLAGGAAFWWQAREIRELRLIAETLRMDRDQAIAVNRANAAALEKARAEAFLADMALAGREREAGRLSAGMAALQRELREKSKHEMDLDRLVSPVVADALRMQHTAASGHPIPGDAGRAAASPDARTAHSGSASRVAHDPWRQLTYRDLVEWIGDLLRHAGLERADKFALRRWVECSGELLEPEGGAGEKSLKRMKSFRIGPAGRLGDEPGG